LLKTSGGDTIGKGDMMRVGQNLAGCEAAPIRTLADADPPIDGLGKISAGHGNEIAYYQPREEQSPILDIEGDEEEQCSGVDTEGGEKEQPLGIKVDDCEENGAGDGEGLGGRPKRKRGVSKAKRWSHVKVKGPSKIKPPNGKLLECLLLNPQNKWALQQSGGLQRSSCSLASRQRLLLTGEFASHGEG
jgi:hypothetical protein